MKKILRFLLVLILVIVLAVSALLGWLTVTEFKPGPVEEMEVDNSVGAHTLESGDELHILSWNIGYGGLGKDSDFFMDGGKDARSADKPTVMRYLQGIAATIAECDPELVLLQEVDINSSRTYSVDEREYLDADMNTETYALNYSCPFVPVPVPPIGKVNSGLFTLTDDLLIEHAQRYSLPCPFSWPLRIANLKRCLLVSYLPIEGTDKQLVLINLHLEAYDDGEGKIAQTQQLRQFMQEEYRKGNYVVAGGDFNQTFPGSLDVYPILDPTFWTPGILENELLADGWRFAYDNAVPTCRLLNQPYDPSDIAHTQYYVIDGFILSPNVELKNVTTLDCAFENSDHNPVELIVELK